MTSFKAFLGVTAALVAIAPSAAHATPYAFAGINFSNFALTGLNSTNLTVNSSTVTTSSSAVYDSAPAAAFTATGTLTAGSDVQQSFSGPGPAPAQNTYTPALSSTAGARGDSILSGNIASGSASAADVAEALLLAASSTASSAGGTTTGINLTITVATAPVTIGLSFNASEFLTATTSAAGDGASAQTNASFTVTGGAIAPFVYSPDALNGSVSASGVGGSQSITTPTTAFSTSVTLAPGTYQLSLLSGAQERLSSGAVAVPEPASLAMMGIGLAGLGFLRRRKRG